MHRVCLFRSLAVLCASGLLVGGCTDRGLLVDSDEGGYGEDTGAGEGCESIGGGSDGGFDQKARIDVPSLKQNGVEVQIDGTVASATIPLCGAVSTDPSDATLALYFYGSVAITLTSDTTGISTNLADNGVVYVEGAPTFPGEYTWSLNDPLRDAWTVTFYNETPLGRMLQVGGGYTAEVSVSDNPYIENLSPLDVAITVVE